MAFIGACTALNRALVGFLRVGHQPAHRRYARAVFFSKLAGVAARLFGHDQANTTLAVQACVFAFMFTLQTKAETVKKFIQLSGIGAGVFNKGKTAGTERVGVGHRCVPVLFICPILALKTILLKRCFAYNKRYDKFCAPSPETLSR